MKILQRGKVEYSFNLLKRHEQKCTKDINMNINKTGGHYVGRFSWFYTQ